MSGNAENSIRMNGFEFHSASFDFISMELKRSPRIPRAGIPGNEFQMRSAESGNSRNKNRFRMSARNQADTLNGFRAFPVKFATLKGTKKAPARRASRNGNVKPIIGSPSSPVAGTNFKR
jgi:hypothetical protein